MILRNTQLINVILHRVLIERDLPEDTDAVQTKKEVERIGLVLAHSTKEELDKKAKRENASMDKGVVVQIGETAFKDYQIDCPIKVGDYISYAKFGGKELIDPETKKEYVVIQDEDVVAILTRNPKDGE